ncbi:hypothetical protein PRIPAC_71838 [Pristionchus pacificus]|uniref:Uncharacterized protein n=1 Tax=Pristionchus pacificus TaxID=54126 RepID=A0A2A6C084_PRIPA|nr:hypothetical protein PRIPAC_71838 [Pristionchus pacificus]|eukprot:PDM71497.1 hypothetical protein PRIPAC_37904 [Pristionchus pacificus]
MFNNIKHRMWKKCLTPVMNKLGKNNLLLEQTRFGVYEISVSSHSNYLEPVQLDIVNIITSLFTCKVWPYRTPIRVNVINSKAAEFFPWLKFIKKINVDELEYHTSTLSKDDHELLLQLAEVSKAIQIVVDANYKRMDIIPLAREIFQRKCAEIEFEEDLWRQRSFISVDDIERLLKFVNGLNKKVKFRASVDASPGIFNIGMYRIEIGQVSKAMMVRANAILYTVANPFRVQKEGESSCKISFGVRNKLKNIMWKNCFTFLTKKLGKDNVIFEQTRLLETALISVIVTAEQIDHLIGYIKPLLDNLTIFTFELEAVPLKIINIITNFFKDKIGPSIIPIRVNVTNSKASEFFPWLELIKKVNVNRLEYRTSSISKDDCALLIQLAGVAKLIRIIVDVSYNRIDIVPLIREMFRRKCVQIIFEEDFGLPIHTTFLSIEDVDRLIKYFHNLTKKVRFYAFADASPIVSQIGMYRVVLSCTVLSKRMTVDILAFPRTATETLGSYLSLKSIVRLRENEDSVKLSFGISNRKKYKMWTNFVDFVTQTLDIQNASLQQEATMFQPSSMFMTVNAERLRTFTRAMRPLLEASMIVQLALETVPKAIAKIISDVFKNKKVLTIFVNVKNSNAVEFSPWLPLITRFNPLTINYTTSTLTKSADFKLLLRFASISRTIRIYKSVDVVPLIREILLRRCANIDLRVESIRDMSSISFLSTRDIERLLQSFNSVSKKIRFLAFTDAQPMNIQIGTFKVCVTDEPNAKHITIESI